MMEVEDGLNKAKGSTENEWLQLEELPRPFDAVGKDLASLGALSIDDFLSNAVSTFSAIDISFHLQIPDPPAPEKEVSQPGKVIDEPEDCKPALEKSARAMVSMLRTTAQSVFGSAGCLSFEYLEEDETKTKQCILTITRPNGTTRSYKSDTGFTRRLDAKAQAAQIAVDMGALDFITSGDADALKAKKGLLLNPFNVEIDNMDADETTAEATPKSLGDEEPLKQIEDSCNEWRAGKVKPYWVSYNDPKNKKKHGAALRIALNAHLFRAYSVDPTYDTIRAAKVSCAKLALKEGVTDFIQFGNGQLEPAKVVDDGLDSEALNIPGYNPLPLKGFTLQEYYESLPQPFPEDVGEQPAAEINAPAWLNITLQSARGGRLVSGFTAIVDSTRHLHGCILRIERPEETKTYLVDPQFPKRSDAKSAVCLLAMSQGVGDYIRGLKEEAENKLPADKRKLANEKLLQVLAAECGKVRQGNRLIFTFASDRDAFGCTLKADVSGKIPDPDIREYTVPPEYRTKADAKAAVACLAAEQGLVDLLRFRGATPPPDYLPFWEAQINGDGDTYVPKRKELDRDDGEVRDRKKRRKGNKDNVSEPSESTSTPQPIIKLENLPGSSSLPPKPTTVVPANFVPPNARWRKSHATGSRGLGQANAYAPASRSVGQDRSGSRSGGGPQHPRDHRFVSASSPSTPTSYDRYSHPRPYDDRSDYGSGPSYQSPSTYSPPDSYGNAYPPYPPLPPQGYYSPPHPDVYHPPAPVTAPPPPHHYSDYYGAPSPHAPPPPHSPYGHYPYPLPHYPQQYPSSSYSGTYSPHPPPLYSPPPPPPPPDIHDYPHHPVNGPDVYASRYHRYSVSPPPFPPSPPRHGYHASHPSHPVEYASYEMNRQGPDFRRRHSTVNDSRPRVTNGSNGYHPPEAPGEERHYKRKTPPRDSPRDREWQRNDRHSPTTWPRNYPEELAPAAPVKKEPDSQVPPISTPLPDAILKAVASTASTNLNELYEYCAKENIPKPTFFSETVEEKDGTTKYTVWAEKDSQRLELQNHFATVDEGYEKLSKKVLQWERSRRR